ncbi:zinc-binding dehydrogenase [Geodermatophilus amargosae]|uniref:zinc-binding dehydrogenase n=1 Tax=Geodermatophilus amargosae TaxID=1296565 RepID=UPI0034DFF274
MCRVLAREFGPPEGLVVEQAAVPFPDEGRVLVEMRAGVVSFVNSLLVRGAYQVRHPLPFVPGTTGVGVVRAVGPGCSASWVGRRVAITQMEGGCLATHALVRRDALASVPDDVPDAVGAAVLEAWSTMQLALTRRHRLQPGETILVLGAGGAIGRAAVDVASALGGRVIAAGSSRARLTWAADRADVDLVDLSVSGLGDGVRALAPGGVDVVVDPVGGPLATEALRSLAPFGAHLVLGFASGDVPRFGANRVLIANKTVVGVDLGHALGADPALAERLMSEVLEAVSTGRYRPCAPVECALEEVPGVLAEIERGTRTGQVVVTMRAPTG